MYGIINRAIEQLVTAHRGTSGWQRVCRHAGIPDHGFVAIQAYPDDWTFRLVQAVSVELDMPASAVLEAFGQYWVLYTAEKGYGEVLQASGRSLRECLAHLDDLHGRIESTFPHMTLPRFSVDGDDEHSFDLLYESEREGLAPMVVGLIKGLALRYGESVHVEHLQAKSAGHGQDRFRITRQQPATADPSC